MASCDSSSETATSIAAARSSEIASSLWRYCWNASTASVGRSRNLNACARLKSTTGTGRSAYEASKAFAAA